MITMFMTDKYALYLCHIDMQFFQTIDDAPTTNTYIVQYDGVPFFYYCTIAFTTTSKDMDLQR